MRYYHVPALGDFSVYCTAAYSLLLLPVSLPLPVDDTVGFDAW